MPILSWLKFKHLKEILWYPHVAECEIPRKGRWQASQSYPTTPILTSCRWISFSLTLTLTPTHTLTHSRNSFIQLIVDSLIRSSIHSPIHTLSHFLVTWYSRPDAIAYPTPPCSPGGIWTINTSARTANDDAIPYSWTFLALPIAVCVTRSV